MDEFYIADHNCFQRSKDCSCSLSLSVRISMLVQNPDKNMQVLYAAFIFFLIVCDL